MTGKYEEERNLDKSVQGEYDRLDTGNNCILEGTFIACIFVSANCHSDQKALVGNYPVFHHPILSPRKSVSRTSLCLMQIGDVKFS